MLVCGGLSSAGTKKTWTCTRSTTCITANLSSGTQWIWTATRHLKNLPTHTSKTCTGSALSFCVTKQPWLSPKSYSPMESRCTKLFSTKESSLSRELKPTIAGSTQDSILQRLSTLPCQTGSPLAKRLAFAIASTTVWESTWMFSFVDLTVN